MNNIDVSTITVKEVMDGISKKKFKVKDVAEAFGKEFNREGKTYSDRAIQNKISSLGYKWDVYKAVYNPIGDGYKAENDSMLFADLFKKNPLKQARTISDSTNKVSKQSPKTTNKKSVSSEDSTDSNNSTNKSTNDSIDSILFGNQKPAKVHRAYYLDKDLADIIDKVEGKQKSNLVNECIRKVFMEKGIL